MACSWLSQRRRWQRGVVSAAVALLLVEAALLPVFATKTIKLGSGTPGLASGRGAIAGKAQPIKLGRTGTAASSPQQASVGADGAVGGDDAPDSADSAPAAANDADSGRPPLPQAPLSTVADLAAMSGLYARMEPIDPDSTFRIAAASWQKVVAEFPSMSANPLHRLAFALDTDKTDTHVVQYWDVYWRHLRDLRESVRSVLEIGVWKGRSMLLWREFFPNAVIYGVELDPSAEELMRGVERTKVFTGPQNDTELLNRIAEEAGGFDLIIDDGSHQYSDQIGSFLALMPHVRPGGLYFIEDVHTSYFEAFGGSYSDFNGISAMTFFSGLVHNVNHRVYKRAAWPKGQKSYIAAYLGNYAETYDPITDLDRMVGSISFSDGLIIVEKSDAAKRDEQNAAAVRFNELRDATIEALAAKRDAEMEAARAAAAAEVAEAMKNT